MNKKEPCGDCLHKESCRYSTLDKKCRHYTPFVKPESMLTTIKTKEL